VLAWCTTLAAFPLIWMGGLVTSHGVGLIVPDWPNSFGYNMFLLPLDLWMQQGVFLEHTHRVLGTVVGFFAILLVACAWLSKNTTRTQRWVAVAVLLAVIVQGVMGGLRVVLISLHLAITHGIFAQVTLCLMGLMMVVSSRWWLGAPRLIGENEATAGSLRRLAKVAVVLILGQLIVGALMRHHQAGLAIPDLPLHYGKLLPPMTSEELAAANASRMADPKLGQVTFFQVWLHFGHRMGAIIVSAVLVWLIVKVLRKLGRFAELAVPAISVAVLLIVQVTLGILTVYWNKPADIASLHVAIGALLLLVTFVLAVRIHGVFRPDPGVEPRGVAVAPDYPPDSLGARAVTT
jgi:heme a synthase